MNSSPYLVSTQVCEDGGELRVCLGVYSIHSMYEATPESGAFKLNLLWQVLYDQWKYPNLRKLDMWDTVLHVLGDKRCIRHIQTLQYTMDYKQWKKKKTHFFQNGKL